MKLWRKRGLSPIILPIILTFLWCIFAMAEGSTTATYVVEIRKYGTDFKGSYYATLSADRRVHFSGRLLPNYINRQSIVLSVEEYEKIITFLSQRSTLESVPRDPVIPSPHHFNASADVTFLVGGIASQISLATHMKSHNQWFDELTTLMRIESLRCPFIIEWRGELRDSCVVGEELQRQLDVELNR